MWAEYHRRQANTLVNLALLTDSRETAVSMMRIARQHAERARQAERNKGSKYTSSLPAAESPAIQPQNSQPMPPA